MFWCDSQAPGRQVLPSLLSAPWWQPEGDRGGGDNRVRSALVQRQKQNNKQLMKKKKPKNPIVFSSVPSPDSGPQRTFSSQQVQHQISSKISGICVDAIYLLPTVQDEARVGLMPVTLPLMKQRPLQSGLLNTWNRIGLWPWFKHWLFGVVVSGHVRLSLTVPPYHWTTL